MTAISATAPSIGDALAQLISGGSGGSRTPAAISADSASLSTAASIGNSGAATVVTLSDQAKAVAKAQSDQVAADNLQAYVEAHRVTGNATKAAPTGSLRSILDANNQSPATQPTDPQPTTGSKVATIVARITTLADADQLPPFQAFTPTKSLSNSATVDGFTLTLDTNASTQFYGIQLSGSGTQFCDKHFGPSDEATGGGGLSPDVVGVGISSGTVDNNEALDAVTITQNIATASSASSSSPAGSISTSSVNAQSSSVAFLINYAAGQISTEQSAASLSTQSTRIGSPGSTLSTLA